MIAAGVTGGVLSGVVQHRKGRAIDWAVPVITTAVIVGILAVVFVIGYSVQTQRPLTRALFDAGGPGTTRRVGRQLRRGRQVSVLDRATAQALVTLYARRWWLGWCYLGLAVAWLALSIPLRGDRLWWHLALGVLYLLISGQWWWMRVRLLRHAAEQGIEPAPVVDVAPGTGEMDDRPR